MKTQNVQTIPQLKNLDPLQVLAVAQKQSATAFLFETHGPQGLTRSIIGLGATEILRLENGVVTSVRDGRMRVLQQPYFEVVEERIRQIQHHSLQESPYAQGGLFGALGFECVAEIESKVKSADHQSGRKSAGPDAELFVAQRLIIFEHQSHELHLIDATNSGSKFLDHHVILNAAMIEPLHPTAEGPLGEVESERLQPMLGPQAFTQQVRTLKKHIRQGDLFQAVLAERFEVQTSASAFEIFRALRQSSRSPYCFYFPFAQSSFFGASPEMLLQVEKGQMRTHPIAGTRPRGATRAQDLLQAKNLLRSRKEAAEHLMLVDLARNDLGRVASPGSVHLHSFRSIQRLPNVMHLVSEVRGALAEKRTSLQALKACFPAGTLSGAPKIRALEVLTTLEPQRRGFYGGAIVAFDGQQGLDGCIAIRCIEMSGNRAILRAGAGIVADSRADREYQEIHDKLKMARKAIATAEGQIQ